MDRKSCTHETLTRQILIVAWCVRCSSWQVHRVGLVSGFGLAFSTPERYESHILPAEDTGPDDAAALARRAFQGARELEVEARGSGR